MVILFGPCLRCYTASLLLYSDQRVRNTRPVSGGGNIDAPSDEKSMKGFVDVLNNMDWPPLCLAIFVFTLSFSNSSEWSIFKFPPSTPQIKAFSTLEMLAGEVTRLQRWPPEEPGQYCALVQSLSTLTMGCHCGGNDPVWLLGFSHEKPCCFHLGLLKCSFWGK